MAGVGTRLLFENDRILVWEFVLEAGESTPLHTHQHDYVWVVIEGSDLETFSSDGASLGVLPAKTGMSFAFSVSDDALVSSDGKGLRGPATHRARNVGTGRYREILVETKD